MLPRKHGSFGKRFRRSPHGSAAAPVELRIIGGRFRGRKLLYSGDPRIRPMKDRVREAIFNLLGPSVRGKHAIDLFAGTGAVGLEALSRGATSATFIERHVPTARIVRQNAARLDVADRVEVLDTNAFLWAKRDLPALPTKQRVADRSVSGNEGGTDTWLGTGKPWVVFVCPPYAVYVAERDSCTL